MKTKEFIEKIIEEEMNGCFRDCCWDNREQLANILERYHKQQSTLSGVVKSLNGKGTTTFEEWCNINGVKKLAFNVFIKNNECLSLGDVSDMYEARTNL